jgi:hypothetical protein
MRLIFLYGMPATGKLTVAQELAKLSGYKLFHNHLVVDLLLSTFEFGSTPFVELREQIWLSVFDQACRSRLEGMIFTFNPETSVRPGFVAQTIETVSAGGGEVIFVELVCPLEELKQRIGSPSRLNYRKLSSLSLFETLQAAGEFDTAHMPPPALTIDTSRNSPLEAATQICDTLHLDRSNGAAADGFTTS